MKGDKVIREYEAFVSYLDIDNKTIEGWYVVVGDNGWALKFKTSGGNILTIPHCRILRLKEREVE